MEAIERILENGFIINRESTKHKKVFKYNTFIRPMTWNCFFSVLSESNVNLTSYDLYLISMNKFATNFHTDYKSDVYLHICADKCFIEINNTRRIFLDETKVVNLLLPNFNKEFFNTDFGYLKHSDEYYSI